MHDPDRYLFDDPPPQRRFRDILDWRPPVIRHRLDEASVVNLETGKPWPMWAGDQPQDPDPRCVCGREWLDDGCDRLGVRRLLGEGVRRLLGPAERRKRRRRCFHHNHTTGNTYIESHLIDFGRSKLFWCTACDRRWTV